MLSVISPIYRNCIQVGLSSVQNGWPVPLDLPYLRIWNIFVMRKSGRFTGVLSPVDLKRTINGSPQRMRPCLGFGFTMCSMPMEQHLVISKRSCTRKLYVKKSQNKSTTPFLLPTILEREQARVIVTRFDRANCVLRSRCFAYQCH